MTDMENLVEAFVILARYDDTRGDVSVGREENIFAGPQLLEQDEFAEEDRSALEALGWYFDDEIGRWGRHL